jgi:filamentous hemagglutinin
MFIREVEIGNPIGIDKFTGKPTSTLTVLTDKFGNLETAFPGKLVIP